MCGCLSCATPSLGTWPATQACALTGNRTGDLLVHRPALNPLSDTSQGSLFLTTNIFQQASIISKQRGKMNWQCTKPHALFLAAGTQYMSWDRNTSITIQSFKKKTIVLFILPAAKEQEKCPSPKGDFSPKVSQNSARVSLAAVAPTWSAGASQRRDTASDEKNCSSWRQAMCID